MSEENKDLGDKAEDAFDKAKEKASEFADDAKESAKEFTEDTKEAAGDFKEEAKKTASEFSEGLKDAGGENKKVLVGILAIVFGSLGVHKFLLGYNKEGIILLVATIVGYATSCLGVGVFILMATGIVGLIEGIIYLTKSDEEFYNTYQVGKKPWF
ncbi:MAG TPA: NINE protein [Eudoraea sp.]|nr:NINE protein [Eudoraea sp.]